MNSQGFGYDFWNEDGDGCIDACEFYKWVKCFAGWIGCFEYYDQEFLIEYTGGDCCFRKSEWKDMIKDVCPRPFEIISWPYIFDEIGDILDSLDQYDPDDYGDGNSWYDYENSGYF